MRTGVIVALVMVCSVLAGAQMTFAQSYDSYDSQDAEVAAVSSSLDSEIAGEDAERADDMRDMDEDMQGNEMRLGIGDSY